MSDTIIAGAGLAGLITACLVPNAEILEAGQPYMENHRALLRFRDESVSHATGIPFRAVRVHKSIWHMGSHYDSCNPSLANQYARKVTGVYSGDRSIWNLDPVTRYVAPEDFYERLCRTHYQRISWNTPLDLVTHNQRSFKIVSTIPLPVMIGLCDGLTAALGNTPVGLADMTAAPIVVRRYRLPHGSNVYQTVYFPDHNTRLFRASITGDLLIVESMADQPNAFSLTPEQDDLIDVLEAFGIYSDDVAEIERVDQKYGKIVDIPRAQREAILYELTRDYNVFSVGRFATWRNILLDDVVKDIGIVKRLMDASAYGRDLVLATR